MITWKHVSAVVGACGISILASLWTLAHRDAQVEEHEKRLIKLETRGDAQDVRMGAISETLGRIDERVLLLLKMSGNVVPPRSRP